VRAWGQLGEDPRICASATSMVYQSVEYSRDSAAIRANVWPGLYQSLRIAGTRNGSVPISQTVGNSRSDSGKFCQLLICCPCER